MILLRGFEELKSDLANFFFGYKILQESSIKSAGNDWRSRKSVQIIEFVHRELKMLQPKPKQNHCRSVLLIIL